MNNLIPLALIATNYVTEKGMRLSWELLAKYRHFSGLR